MRVPFKQNFHEINDLLPEKKAVDAVVYLCKLVKGKQLFLRERIFENFTNGGVKNSQVLQIKHDFQTFLKSFEASVRILEKAFVK